jgi:hypothetical protein
MTWHSQQAQVIPVETSEISLHRLRVFLFLEKAGGWQTNKDVTKGASVAARTARAHTKALVDLGILDQADVFPAHRYRVSEQAKTRNKAYMIRLREAAKVFGLE